MPKEAFENPMDDINERQKQLLNQLRENRFLTIPELAQRLYASVATIRRDLKKLESMNLAKITASISQFLHLLLKAEIHVQSWKMPLT